MFKNICAGCKYVLICFTANIALIVNSPVFAQSADLIVYVDADSTAPTPDGNTWATAYPFLQDALTEATQFLAGNSLTAQIWVANGVYKPDQGSGYTAGNRNHSFKLLERCRIAGGFHGNPSGEINFLDRDPLNNLTLLSGDLSSNDSGATPSSPSWDDNSYHVVTADRILANGILDGFWVIRGNGHGAPLPDPNQPTVYGQGGGGLLLIAGTTINNADICKPVILQCRFESNWGATGGAVYAGLFHGSAPLFENCRFLANRASDDGGAVFIHGPGNPCPNGCPDSGEPEATQGGLIFVNCLFDLNAASDKGGAIFSDEFGTLKVTNCTIALNTASSSDPDNAGGIHHMNECECITEAGGTNIVHSILWDNSPNELFGAQHRGVSNWAGQQLQHRPGPRLRCAPAPAIDLAVH